MLFLECIRFTTHYILYIFFDVVAKFKPKMAACFFLLLEEKKRREKIFLLNELEVYCEF